MKKIYTRSGDTGDSGIFGGPRLRKDDPRFEVYGTVDELNALLGQARSESPPAEMDRVLEAVQHELFDMGAELASLDPVSRGTRTLGARNIEEMERTIDRFEAQLPPLQHFILPGGTRLAAVLHVARTLCRRAERRLVTLMSASQDEVSSDLLIYLNRLGDLLFVLARTANHLAGRTDVQWRKRHT